MTREEWLIERRKGIGASDASAVLGINPWKNNVTLWKEKCGLIVPKDIGEQANVRYGIEAESHLRELFALDHPQYNMHYEEFYVFSHPRYPFLLATLDGWLDDKANLRNGVYEGKTTEIMGRGQYDHWKDDKDGNQHMPPYYFSQAIHQLLVTGYAFVELKAQIKFAYPNKPLKLETKHYHIERSDVLDDIEYLLEKEIAFWDCVEKRIEPPLILPSI